MIFPKERSFFPIRFEVKPLCQKPFAIMQVVQVRVMQFCRNLIRWQILQILSEALHALLAKTAAILECGDGKLSFIQLDAIHSSIDLNTDDSFEVFAPNGVVAIHHKALMLSIRSFDPARMTRLPVNITRDTGLDQISDFVAIAIDETIRKIFFERRPKFRISILRKLAQAHPNLFAHTAQLIERENLCFVFIQLDWNFPALYLKDNAKDFDAVFLAFMNEFTVIDISIEPEARVNWCKGFLFKIG